MGREQTAVKQVIKQIEGGVCAAKGLYRRRVNCGIRKNKLKKDLALIVSAVPPPAPACIRKTSYRARRLR